MHERPKQHGNHGADAHGGHAFTDPAELAKKWNAAERDAWQHPEEIVAALALQPGATVAEIGAGTGYMVAHLSKAVGERGTVIAVDAEEAMIAYVASRVEALGPATVRPQKVTHGDPKLPPESVDAILTLDTWHHIDERVEYARKLYAALRPGGRLVVVDYHVDAEVGPPQEMRVSPQQVVAELAEAGFRAEIADESMPRHYMVVGKKD